MNATKLQRINVLTFQANKLLGEIEALRTVANDVLNGGSPLNVTLSQKAGKQVVEDPDGDGWAFRIELPGHVQERIKRGSFTGLEMAMHKADERDGFIKKHVALSDVEVSTVCTGRIIDMLLLDKQAEYGKIIDELKTVWG